MDMIHNSWFLAKLCAEVAAVYVKSSLRGYTDELLKEMDPTGKIAIERYLRQCFQQYKTLAWPSQVIGINRLTGYKSFVLCTPTGSGKTTIAELAILQSLFLNFTPESPAGDKRVPLALYLVPSRALAAEVESSLSRVLRKLNDPPINVTGLYGGNDWGPTDAWLTADAPTVLICTYEKAEALIRFLGPLFLKRVSLVVIDEAHSIQFDGNFTDLRKAESRSLRLEVLGTRLFTYLDQSKGRVIALSAVASKMQNVLARWVNGEKDARPAETSYRSTRQLIGRLECLPNRSFTIHYDLLDGADLQFEKGSLAETPYISYPFASCPSATKWETKATNKGPEKRLRPYLFWAAMQLANQYHKGQYGAVLISVTQYINGFAEDFLTLLDSIWINEVMPIFFVRPQDTKKEELWQRCLRSCEDYFGKASHEYKLLEKGIVVHHGKMPGLMARLLVQIVQERIVHIVLATSTLSEGVNLPIETVLIPSLQRRGNSINAREFSNLVGRAGRPGVGTEGRSLVLLENDQGRNLSEAQEIRRVRRRYFELISEIKGGIEVTDKETGAQSPLAELLNYLVTQWNQYFPLNNQNQFFEWLEKVAPLDIKGELNEEAGLSVIEAVDTLDSLLISIITELEQIEQEVLTTALLEDRLRQIWQRSYAYYASTEEQKLDEIFVRRGGAINSTIYSDKEQRRRLYRTSLPPRSGDQMLKHYPTIIEHLKTGEEYALWTKEQRFDYIEKTVDLLGKLDRFALNKKAGRKTVVWQDVLRWWLNPASQVAPKTASDISSWYDYVSQNFGYKFNWGLGSIIALAGDELHGGIIMETSLQDWPLMQLPWIVFWLKELITWGTLEPIAAYLLAKNVKTTRKDAEAAALLYYEERSYPLPDELLNAATIRNWVDMQYPQNQLVTSNKPFEQINVRLLRDFSKIANKRWRVIPIESESEIHWFDPAGFPLAVCRKPMVWESYYLNTYDFLLNTSNAIVSSSPYL